MVVAYRAPGVYREEIFLQPAVSLPTGVPGFVGFFTARNSEDQPPVGLAINSPIFLQRQEEFTEQFVGETEGYLKDAVIGFFNNGGTRCYVVAANPQKDRETALKESLEALAPVDDLDLVAVPDGMTLRLPNQQLDEAAVIRLQRAVLEHCATQGDRLGILDALPIQELNPSPSQRVQALKDQREQITANQKEPLNGALYYPWLKNAQGRLVPPCGHVAGIFARSDRDRGVFKAPANQEIRDALDLEVSIDNDIQAQLNPEGINCLRTFPGRGIRVWGARTLSREQNWRYISVRRIFLTLGRWLELNLSWATFEPNSPQLWIRIQREVSAYLTQLWQAGALQGQTSEQAFYVKCDAETNPPEGREAGQVVTEIGLAAASPAEFIIVRIIHRPSTTEII